VSQTIKETEVSVQQRTENLAFVFQEVLTAITRLRTNRQSVSDAPTFRMQVKEALAAAEREARQLGYSQEAVRLAIFGTVAFLDESVLNQRVPAFSDWARKPLQEELFGVHIAGEIFFDNLQRLMGQTDSSETADVLEVYQLCLLLGYRGRYGTASKGEVTALIHSIDAKIRRVHGGLNYFSPAWMLPGGEIRRVEGQRGERRLLAAFAVCFVLAVLLFIGFRLSLDSWTSTFKTVAAQQGK
jgi:type VI secretion system protein ImpK